jgi:hypothetical protein
MKRAGLSNKPAPHSDTQATAKSERVAEHSRAVVRDDASDLECHAAKISPVQVSSSRLTFITFHSLSMSPFSSLPEIM